MEAAPQEAPEEEEMATEIMDNPATG